MKLTKYLTEEKSGFKELLQNAEEFAKIRKKFLDDVAQLVKENPTNFDDSEEIESLEDELTKLLDSSIAKEIVNIVKENL